MADWNSRANQIFVRSVEIESTEERAAFLEKSCGLGTSWRGDGQNHTQLAGAVLEFQAGSIEEDRFTTSSRCGNEDKGDGVRWGSNCPPFPFVEGRRKLTHRVKTRSGIWRERSIRKQVN